jgi:UDP-GlcNAc:undecaprenyl-phosphate/decaprenyl-phosphate GlcNAc-1-phosphate transferase
VFLRPLGLCLPDYLVLPLSVIFCLMVVVAACNATNLLDGLDGLCGGVTGIIALGFLALAIWLALWNQFPGTDELRVALCFAMAGAVLGFLPYNIPPASIFMGDAGSMLLGFFVATMMALFCQEGNARWFIAALAVFILPILDTALAVVRRLAAGKPIFAGDRSHLYDQLVDRGMTVKQVVVLFYILAALAAAMGVVLAVFLHTHQVIPIYIALFALVWVIFWRLGMISERPKGPRPPQADDGDRT